jgi:hypothetical protein
LHHANADRHGKTDEIYYMNQDKSHPKEDSRSGMDRRHVSFNLHIPERRSGLDRRKSVVLEQRKKSLGQNDS